MNQYLYEGKAKEIEQMTKDALAEERSVQEVLSEGLIAGMSVVGEDSEHNILYGIIESHLYRYRHLGDASTSTDNLIYNPKLGSLPSDGFTTGTFDDRLTFTSKLTPLN